MVIEAFATGLPVIASNFGGIPEIIAHGKTGLLAAPENIEEFGKAIVFLAEDGKLRIKMGQKGRKKIEEDFDWKISIEKMLKIYAEANNIS